MAPTESTNGGYDQHSIFDSILKNMDLCKMTRYLIGNIIHFDLTWRFDLIYNSNPKNVQQNDFCDDFIELSIRYNLWF